MLKKILKALLGQSHKHRYSSSDYHKHHKHYNHHQYGHGHYKKKHKSHSFFSSFLSS
ncbi:hypothetical protein [Ectobacillus ponti]|uniref:Uncharacterized protein n=1 Tax=Ectobacillus ponti TaxID=2961894 RepID=A0AA41X7P6_9BACI|nr:hypothetical protein [Ectobacillus ponti]MCP8970337.1 hypothetical protein [Ectobacillus ponti]